MFINYRAHNLECKPKQNQKKDSFKIWTNQKAKTALDGEKGPNRRPSNFVSRHKKLLDAILILCWALLICTILTFDLSTVVLFKNQKERKKNFLCCFLSQYILILWTTPSWRSPDSATISRVFFRKIFRFAPKFAGNLKILSFFAIYMRRHNIKYTN